ncbi:Yip1-domain-containing protein, partial [Ramicandelaber brevisporus]
MANSRYDVVVDIDDEDPLQFTDYRPSVLSTTSGTIGSNSAQQQQSSAPKHLRAPLTPFEPAASQQQQQQQQQPPPPAGNGNASIWSVEYYSSYFDVDSIQVVERININLLPWRGGRFLAAIGDRPEVYGPFWIATTLVLAMYVTSSLAESIAALLSGAKHDSDINILSLAAAVIYPYVFVVPGLLWLFTKYMGIQASLIELWCVYGYGLAPWFIVCGLCVIPNELLRWVFVGLGAVQSLQSMGRSLLAILKRSGQMKHTALLVVVIGLHVALAFFFKIALFSYKVPIPQLPGTEPSNPTP